MISHQKIMRELKSAGRKIGQTGLIIGEGGNISARIGSIIYIKKKAASMGNAKLTGYIPVDIKRGKPLRKKDKPSTEIYMHLACYRTRKNIGAVVHTHPIFATALGMAGVDIRPVTYELAVNIKSPIARIGYIKPGTPELGRAIGRAMKKHNAVLLKNHGLVTVGKDLKEAFLRTLAVERAALTYVASKSLKS